MRRIFHTVLSGTSLQDIPCRPLALPAHLEYQAASDPGNLARTHEGDRAVELGRRFRFSPLIAHFYENVHASDGVLDV